MLGGSPVLRRQEILQLSQVVKPTGPDLVSDGCFWPTAVSHSTDAWQAFDIYARLEKQTLLTALSLVNGAQPTDATMPS